MNKKLLFIFVLAFLLRLIALNQSIWLDEGTTAKAVMQYNYSEIITKFSPFDFHPPLFYLFMKFWTNIFGYSEIALRMPSVLFSVLTGYLVYLIGGLWAAVFFLFNPLIVYYSQEARMYMQATFLLACSLWFLIKMLQNQKSKLFLFNIFIILAFLTFYGSIFLIIPMLLYLLFKKQYKLFLFSILYFLFSIFLISPLLYQQFLHARESLQTVLNWKSVLGISSIKNLLLIPLKFSFGRISFYPKWLYWAASGIWSIFVWFLIIQGARKNRLFGYLLICPLVIGLLFSFFTPLLQYFRFLFLIPLMSILIAMGINTPVKRLTVVDGFIVLSFIYLFVPQFHREDWKSLAKNLSKNDQIYMILSSADGLKYYNNKLVINELTHLLPPWRDTARRGEIIVIPYTADIYGFNYKKILEENKFHLKQTDNFRGLTKEYWSR